MSNLGTAYQRTLNTDRALHILLRERLVVRDSMPDKQCDHFGKQRNQTEKPNRDSLNGKITDRLSGDIGSSPVVIL